MSKSRIKRQERQNVVGGRLLGRERLLQGSVGLEESTDAYRSDESYLRRHCFLEYRQYHTKYRVGIRVAGSFFSLRLLFPRAFSSQRLGMNDPIQPNPTLTLTPIEGDS